MHLVPKSAQDIAQSLSWMKWRGRIGMAMTGAFAVFFSTMVISAIFGMLPTTRIGVFIFVAVLVGVAGGIVGGEMIWRRAIRRLRQSFIRLDQEMLEIKRLSAGAMTQVRIPLVNLRGIAIGRQRGGIVGSSPALRALDSVSLVIQDKAGKAIAFERIGRSFRRKTWIVS